jgi:hypothetical protein
VELKSEKKCTSEKKCDCPKKTISKNNKRRPKLYVHLTLSPFVNDREYNNPSANYKIDVTMPMFLGLSFELYKDIGDNFGLGLGFDQDFDTRCNDYQPSSGSNGKCSTLKLSISSQGYFANAYYSLNFLRAFAGLHLSNIYATYNDGSTASAKSFNGLGLQFGLSRTVTFNQLGIRIKAMYKLNKQEAEYGNYNIELTANTLSFHLGVDFGKIAGL